jgi:hypothetical protein
MYRQVTASLGERHRKWTLHFLIVIDLSEHLSTVIVQILQLQLYKYYRRVHITSPVFCTNILKILLRTGPLI